MTTKLPCYNIVIDNNRITSDLTKNCRTKKERAAMDVVESLILAHHIAGIDVTSPAYIDGINTSIDAFWNNY